MYLSTSTSTEDFPEMYLSTFQVLYKLYLSTDVLKYKVLLPGSAYQCPANEDNYIEKLEYIHAVIDELNTSCYVVFGDWHANIRDPVNSLFVRHMIDFCHDNNYNILTRLMLPDDSYTHVSEAWGTVSWLDHIVSSSDFHDHSTTIDIDYDCTDVYHIPVLANIALTDMPISRGSTSLKAQ